MLYEWLYEWNTIWMIIWTNEYMNDYMNEILYECIYEWNTMWMIIWMNEYMNEIIYRYEWMNKASSQQFKQWPAEWKSNFIWCFNTLFHDQLSVAWTTVINPLLLLPFFFLPLFLHFIFPPEHHPNSLSSFRSQISFVHFKLEWKSGWIRIWSK